MANSSSAYDYARFDGAVEKRRPAPTPELRMVQAKRAKPRAFAVAFSPRVLCAFFIVVTMVSLIVYNQVCLNEVNGEINQLNTSIARLESDNVRYVALLESTVSLRAVAQQAEEELGMHKLDQYQTAYVYLYEEDKILINEDKQTKNDEGVVAALAALVDGAKEYFGGN